MAQKQPIPCPECDRIKYFEGLCYYCKNKILREKYESLTDSEIQEKINTIIDEIQTHQNLDKLYNEFYSLLAYNDINTIKIAEVAANNNVFFPPELYRNASEETQDKLIELLRNPNCKDANNIQCCLAICGSEKVKNFFYELEKKPLPWRKKLYVNPSVYAEAGGWSFSENGERYEVTYKECYSLLNENRTDDAIKVAETLPENCTTCGCQTINILTLNGNDERLAFLNLNGLVKLPICPNCASMCEKIVIHYKANGVSSFEIDNPFADENYIPEEDFKRLTNNNLVLSKCQKPVYFSCGNDEISTIGGNPQWIQDSQYEKCPSCNQKMKLLANISWSQLLPDAEGNLYIEICTDCSIAVAFHQQT